METKARPFTPTEEKIGSTVIHYIARVNTWLYRASGGKIFGKWLRGAPIGLLLHKGRKTGQWRTNPLLYVVDDGRVVLVASKGGMAKNPLWYENLVANPDCEFEIGAEKRPYRARTGTTEEKGAFWPRLVAMYPDYDNYQARTARDIPIVLLDPR